jgi:hypothetical protein
MPANSAPAPSAGWVTASRAKSTATRITSMTRCWRSTSTRIWQPLLRAARDRGEISAELDERFAWEIMLGRDRTINAFALPGGYLGLHLGLIGVVGVPRRTGLGAGA